MNIKSINPYLFIGFIGICAIGSQFFADIYGILYGNKDIYWTHNEMKLPLEKTADEFQLFISGKPLKKHLSDKTLFAVDENGVQYPVVFKDVSVRLNNWSQVKSRMLTEAVFTGCLFSVSLTLLITGLIQTVTKRKRERY